MRMMKSCLISAATLISASSAFAGDGVIRIAIPDDIRSTNPGVDRSGTTDIVLLNIVEGLVGYKDDLSVGPVLAESFTISDNGLVYTFNLRDGVRFHNGSLMTSADVSWSWDRYMDEATNWRCRSRFTGEDGAKVVSVETPDDDTIIFTIDQPSPLFLKEMARFDCGSTAVLHRESVAPDGSWVSPVGTGPFKFVEWVPGQRVVLERFGDYMPADGERDGYTGRRDVFVDAAEWYVVPDPASAKAAMRAGEIDLMRIFPNDLEEIRDAGFQIVAQPTPSWGVFLISRHDEFMQNQSLRQAMARALDMDLLTEIVGFESHNASPIPPMSTFYSQTQAETYGHDLGRVRELLADSGYEGEPITLTTNRNNQTHYDQAIAAQAMWNAAGINVEIEVLEWGAQLDLYRSGDYQIQSFGFSSRLDPALSWDMFSGEAVRKVWNDADANELISQLMTVTDDSARQSFSDQLHQMFLDRVPAIGLYSQPIYYALSPRVEGFASWPGGRTRLWGVSLTD